MIPKGEILTRSLPFIFEKEETTINRYHFEGAVIDNFGKIIENKWKSDTVAPSSKKAMSNLAFQWKKENGLLPSAKIELDGRLTVV